MLGKIEQGLKTGGLLTHDVELFNRVDLQLMLTTAPSGLPLEPGWTRIWSAGKASKKLLSLVFWRTLECLAWTDKKVNLIVTAVDGSKQTKGLILTYIV
jgi:hypothetical protein